MGEEIESKNQCGKDEWKKKDYSLGERLQYSQLGADAVQQAIQIGRMSAAVLLAFVYDLASDITTFHTLSLFLSHPRFCFLKKCINTHFLSALCSSLESRKSGQVAGALNKVAASC